MWSGPLRYKGLDFFNPESSDAAGDFGRAKLSPLDHSPHRSLSYAQHVRDLACSEETSLPARIRSVCFDLGFRQTRMTSFLWTSATVGSASRIALTALSV